MSSAEEFELKLLEGLEYQFSPKYQVWWNQVEFWSGTTLLLVLSQKSPFPMIGIRSLNGIVIPRYMVI